MSAADLSVSGPAAASKGAPPSADHKRELEEADVKVVPSRTTGTKLVSSGGPYCDDLHVKRRGPFSTWQHATAVFNFAFLISSWVFGIVSPLVLAFFLWNRWFIISILLATAMAYPVFFPVRTWPSLRWFFASATSPHAYYQPHGWSVTFQKGALAALRRRDAVEYYRERANRRKKAGRLVKPTADILPSFVAAATPGVPVARATNNGAVISHSASRSRSSSSGVAGPVPTLTVPASPPLDSMSPVTVPLPPQRGPQSPSECPQSPDRCPQSPDGCLQVNHHHDDNEDGESVSAPSSPTSAAVAASEHATHTTTAAPASSLTNAAAAAAAHAAAGGGAVRPSERRPVLAAFHPHGIFPISFWLGGAICPELFTINPKMTFLISSALYSAPIFLFLIRWMGKFAPADAASTAALMAKGEDIGLIPGGFEEATIYRHGHHRLYLKERRGFIKYALRYGYTVVPVYSFGEEQSYYNATCFTRLRLRLNKWQVPGVLPWGAPGVLPFSSHAMDIVYGEPLEVPHVPEPSDEEVAVWHGRYVERVRETFERNKARFGQPNAQLEIW